MISHLYKVQLARIMYLWDEQQTASASKILTILYNMPICTQAHQQMQKHNLNIYKIKLQFDFTEWLSILHRHAVDVCI